ncbi:P2X purinoceptor 7-like [Anneissia japonica]|uniref:P2X purinoceptor 7-like n=1 Tax=Anneissia japonica TaxID=1529436 RepID=UPI001425B6F4|nr:P2X purinoceptor 7-like [Anneissia japonica]
MASITPYKFEPYCTDDDGSGNEEEAGGENNNKDQSRRTNTDWCSCDKCSVMPTTEECLCCMEILKIKDKFVEDAPAIVDGNMNCITQHPGFRSICLDIWALQLAYDEIPKKGKREGTTHEKYRHTSYRNFVKWIWGYRGKHQRTVIPACAIIKIRSKFQSKKYVGFKYPPL